MKILVIDENKNDRLILKEKMYARDAYCSSCKYKDEVVAVSTAKEGLKVLAQDGLSFDIVIATIPQAAVAIHAQGLGIKKVAIIGKQTELDASSLNASGITLIPIDNSSELYLVPRIGGMTAKKWGEILRF